MLVNFAVFALLLYCCTASAPRPLFTAFPLNTILTAVVTQDDSACEGQGSTCLASVAIQPFIHDDSSKLTRIALPNHTCTLPLVEQANQPWGQVSLSGDGLFASLVCFNAPAAQSVPPSQQPGFTVALIDASGAVDTSTKLLLPSGVTAYSAVSDNGTSLWIGASDGLYFTSVGDVTGLAWTKLSLSPIDGLIGTAAVYHVTIVATMSPDGNSVADGSQGLWLSSGTSLWAASPLPYPGHTISCYQRMVSPDGLTNVTGQAAAFVARGGPHYPTANEEGFSVYTNVLQAPVMLPTFQYPSEYVLRVYPDANPAEPVLTYPSAFAAHANEGNNARNLYSYYRMNASQMDMALFSPQSSSSVASSSTLWVVPTTPSIANLVVDAIAQSAYVAAEAKRQLGSGTFVFATTPMAVYKMSISPLEVPVVQAISRLYAWEASKSRYAGVCLAPMMVVAGSNFTAQITASPTPQPSPSVSATPLVPPPPFSSSPPNGWGIRLPSASAFPSPAIPTNNFRYLLLARVGDNSSSTAVDYRRLLNGTRARLEAQPVFLDFVRLESSTGSSMWDKARVVQTIALPTKRLQGDLADHKACTAPFYSSLVDDGGGDSYMWPKLWSTDGESSLSLNCYGAEIPDGGTSSSKRDIIPTSFYVPSELLSEAFPTTATSTPTAGRSQRQQQRQPWPSHPPRVIANVHAASNGIDLDTRSNFRTDGPCASTRITSSMRVPSSRFGPYVYTAEAVFEDAPKEEYGKCGLRHMAIGVKDSDGLRFSSSKTWDLEDEVKLVFNYQNSLAIFTESLGQEGVFALGSRNDDPVEPWTLASNDEVALANRYELLPLPMEVRQLRMLKTRIPWKFNALAIASSKSFSTVSGSTVTSFVDAFFVATNARNGSIIRFSFNDVIFEGGDGLVYENYAFKPPDGRNVVSMAGDDIQATGTSRITTFFYRTLYVVTADTTDGPTRRAGSALWTCNVNTMLPVGRSIFTSVALHKLVPEPLSSSSVSPSATASPTASSTTPLVNTTTSNHQDGDGFNINNGAGGGGSKATTSSTGTVAGIVIAVVCIFLAVACCVGVSYWRYRKLMVLPRRKQREVALLAIHKEEQQRLGGNNNDDDEREDEATNKADEAAIVAEALRTCEREEELQLTPIDTTNSTTPTIEGSSSSVDLGAASLTRAILRGRQPENEELLPTLSLVEVADALSSVAEALLRPSGDSINDGVDDEDGPVPIAVLEQLVGEVLMETLSVSALSSKVLPAQMKAAFSPSRVASSGVVTAARVASLSEAKAAITVATASSVQASRGVGSLKSLEKDAAPLAMTVHLSKATLRTVLVASARVARRLSSMPSTYFREEDDPENTAESRLSAGVSKIADTEQQGQHPSSSPPASSLVFVPPAKHLASAIVAAALREAIQLQMQQQAHSDSSSPASSSPPPAAGAAGVVAAPPCAAELESIIEEAASKAGKAAYTAAYDRRRIAVTRAMGAKKRKSRQDAADSVDKTSGNGTIIIARSHRGKRSKSDKTPIPSLAELERRYGGALALRSGSSFGVDEPQTPPSFWSFFLSSLSQALQGCLARVGITTRSSVSLTGSSKRYSVALPPQAALSPAARTLQIHYTTERDEAAALAALGLDQQMSGAFVGSNDLLRARVENQLASAATSTTSNASPHASKRPSTAAVAPTRKERKGSVLAASAGVATSDLRSNRHGSKRATTAVVINPLAALSGAASGDR
jgi:hypothetical protein